MIKCTVFVIVILCIYQTFSLPATVEEEEWGVTISVLGGEFSLSWKALDENGNITYNSSQAQTYVVGIVSNGTGWLAWGMSDMAMMMDADMIIGGVLDTGEVYINDYWAVDTTTIPYLDTARGGTYDILDYNGSEANGHTHLLFKRSFFSTDKWDLNPKPSTGMIVAFHIYLDTLVYNNSHTVAHANGFTVPFFTDDLACPNNCTGRGSCLADGTCNCNYGYAASDCSIVATCYSAYDCSYQGTCTNYECVCNAGWTGTNCKVKATYALTPGFSVDQYSYHADALGGALKLYWLLGSNYVEICLVAQGTGWVGVGFGSSMTNADIIMGNVIAGTCNSGDFFSYTEVAPRSDALLGGENNILAYAGVEISGVTTFKFIRLLDTGDKFDTPITQGDMAVIVAFNPSNDDLTADHGPGHNTPITVNFFTGEVRLATNALNTAHAVLMTLGWSVFIVAGIIIARHFKNLGHLWFQLHIFLNVFGIVLILCGFVISFIMVPKISLVNMSRPVAIAHGWIGLITVALGLVQPVIGWYADRVYDKERTEIPVWPDQIHWWLGRGALFLSFVAVPLGMVAYNINRAFVWLYIAYVVVLLTVFILLQKTKGNKHEMELKTLKDSKDTSDTSTESN